MKLKSLREHYKYRGNVWIPKKEFKSLDSILEFGYSPEEQYYYTCNVCKMLHLSTINKKDRINVS